MMLLKKGLFSTVVENSNFQNVVLIHMYMIYDGTIPMPFLNFFECSSTQKKVFSCQFFKMK